MSIAGLKRSDWNEPIITKLDQLFYRGNETQIHCGNTSATKVHQPINIQEFLTDEHLNGNYGPDDYILAHPKQQTLQPEGFKGRVAINEYGIPHDMVMGTDNHQLLTKPKYTSYASTKLGPNIKKTPNIHRDVRDILKDAKPLSLDSGVSYAKPKRVKKVLPDRIIKMHRRRAVAQAEKYKEVTPKTKLDAKHLKERLDMAIAQMDFSAFKREGKKTLSRKHLRDRIQRTVETIAHYTKDPKYNIDLEKHLKENMDIMTGVIAYVEKEPKLKMKLDRYLKEHKEVFANITSSWGKTATNKDRDLLHILKEHNQLAITAPMKPKKNGDAVTKGVASTCYVDDRFVTFDQLDPVEQLAIEPQIAEVRLPMNVKCRNNISY